MQIQCVKVPFSPLSVKKNFFFHLYWCLMGELETFLNIPTEELSSVGERGRGTRGPERKSLRSWRPQVSETSAQRQSARNARSPVAEGRDQESQPGAEPARPVPGRRGGNRLLQAADIAWEPPCRPHRRTYPVAGEGSQRSAGGGAREAGAQAPCAGSRGQVRAAQQAPPPAVGGGIVMTDRLMSQSQYVRSPAGPDGRSGSRGVGASGGSLWMRGGAPWRWTAFPASGRRKLSR